MSEMILNAPTNRMNGFRALCRHFAVLMFFLIAPVAVNARPLRVALMDFSIDDNSHRSTQAAADFTAIIQTKLSTLPDYEWVERVELNRAEDELKLAGFGLIDRSEAVHSGRWVKADWAVFGRISTNVLNNRTINLEVVDMQRADVLAESSLTLTSPNGGPFKAVSADIPAVVSALRSSLEQAHLIYNKSREQTTVALLFLSPTTLGGKVDGLEGEFRRALAGSLANNRSLHVIQFQRAGESMDEANLVLSGLVETDPDAWEKVADKYVWGNYAVSTSKHFDRQTSTWRDEQQISTTLNIWDGKSDPQTITLSVTNKISREAVARQLVQMAEPLLARDAGKIMIEGVREHISRSLATRAVEVMKSPMSASIDSPEGRRQWLEIVQILETACFFDPGNLLARELWARVRWDQKLAWHSNNEFFFARRRSQAWGQYVDQFGFRTGALSPHFGWWETNSVASEYVLSAWRPFEMFAYAQENQAQWGVPRDAGLRELTEWQNQFGSEFVSRLLKAPDDPALLPHTLEFFYKSLNVQDTGLRSSMIAKLWPRFIESAEKSPITFDGAYLDVLKRHFQEVGRPGEDKKLLAQLDAANIRQSSNRQTNIPPTDIDLPRLAGLESVPTTDIFSVRTMAFLPPIVEPNMRTISFPTGLQVKGIKSMVFHGHTLWLAVEISEPFVIRTVNDRVEKDFQPVLVNRVRLWKLDADKLLLEPADGSLATNVVNGMLFCDDTLWLALDDAGIAALNVKTGELRRYASSAGVVSTNQFALAGTSRGIAAIGGLDEFLFMENGAESWKPFSPGLPHQDFMFGSDLRQIVGLKNKLLFYDSELLLCDLESHTWRRLGDQAATSLIGRVSSLISDGQEQFWAATVSGLHSINPDSGQIRSQWIPVLPTIPNSPAPGVPGSNQEMYQKPTFQLAKGIRQKLDLRNKLLEVRRTDASQQDLFVPSSRLPAPVCSMVADDGFLWVLTEDAIRPLLYHPASRSWVGGFSAGPRRMTPAMACGGGYLWVGTQFESLNFGILKIETGPLKSTPRQRWVRDSLSRGELSEHINSLPDDERAIYDFFAGDDIAAIKLLQARKGDMLDAQSLFLLAIAFRETGQANQAKQIETELAMRFPESVFMKCLRFSQRLEEVRSKVKDRRGASHASSPATLQSAAAGAQSRSRNTADEFFQQFDSNNDGALDEAELTILFEFEPQLIRQISFTWDAGAADAASIFLRRNDSNHDGVLQSNELASALRRFPFLSLQATQSHTNPTVPVRVQTRIQ